MRALEVEPYPESLLTYLCSADFRTLPKKSRPGKGYFLMYRTFPQASLDTEPYLLQSYLAWIPSYSFYPVTPAMFRALQRSSPIFSALGR